ncbi:MAG: hypothetical protein V1908_01895 [Candidatus Peregrinibacteria bacterium]
MKNKKVLVSRLVKIVKILLLTLAINTLLLVSFEFTPINALGPWLKANITFSLSILPAPELSPQSNGDGEGGGGGGGGGGGSSYSSDSYQSTGSSGVIPLEPVPTAVSQSPETPTSMPEKSVEPNLIEPPAEPAESFITETITSVIDDAVKPVTPPIPVTVKPPSPPAENPEPPPLFKTAPVTPLTQIITTISPELSSIEKTTIIQPAQKKGGIMSRILVTTEFVLSAALFIVSVAILVV